jgi:hypothetical protein
MPKGDSFTKMQAETEPSTPDVDTFNLRAWITGAAPVTRSVAVCGRPDLMGRIEALKDELERAGAVDDDQRLAGSGVDVMALARELEAARAAMLASMVTFTFRGLRPGELEKIKADHPDAAKADDRETFGGELDYLKWAAQCVKPEGITAEDFRDLHARLGNYLVQTVARTALAAETGGGVDVPFSIASSALIERSSKS